MYIVININKEGFEKLKSLEEITIFSDHIVIQTSACDYISFKCQPERSKREDYCPKCKNILIPNEGSLWCESCDWKGWIRKDNGCGALNSMET